MQTTEQQLQLFDTPAAARRGSGSQNPIVFHDYESFVAKFRQASAKTTDDCYTPPDIYDAVLGYVATITDMTGRQVLRPFYPGGDFENSEYPPDGIVIDNPPFSIFTKVCRFYCERGIPFFVFGPANTILSCLSIPTCSVVIVGHSVIFHNGADVNCGFATNLLGDTMVTTSVSLTRAIGRANRKTKPTRSLPRINYPDELLSFGTFETIARGNEDFAVKRHEAVPVRRLDARSTFGSRLMVSRAAAQRAAAQRAAAQRAAARPTINVEFSPRELAMLERLSAAEG